MELLVLGHAHTATRCLCLKSESDALCQLPRNLKVGTLVLLSLQSSHCLLQFILGCDLYDYRQTVIPW